MPPQNIQKDLCYFCFLRLFDRDREQKAWTQSVLKGWWRLSQVPKMTWCVCLLCGGNPEKATEDVLSPIGRRRRQSISARYQSKAEALYISIVSIRTGNFVKTIPNLCLQLPWARGWFGFPHWTWVGRPQSAFSLLPGFVLDNQVWHSLFISLLVWNWIRRHSLFFISNFTIPGLLRALPVRAANVPWDKLHIHSDTTRTDGEKTNQKNQQLDDRVEADNEKRWLVCVCVSDAFR